jgi:hypothetical protein
MRGPSCPNCGDLAVIAAVPTKLREPRSGAEAMSGKPEEPRFGPHSAAVEELIDFVEAGGVLAKPFDAATPTEAMFDYLVLQSLHDVDIYRKPWVEGARIKRRSWFENIKRTDTAEYLMKGLFADDLVLRCLRVDVPQRRGPVSPASRSDARESASCRGDRDHL